MATDSVTDISSDFGSPSSSSSSDDGGGERRLPTSTPPPSSSPTSPPSSSAIPTSSDLERIVNAPNTTTTASSSTSSPRVSTISMSPTVSGAPFVGATTFTSVTVYTSAGNVVTVTNVIIQPLQTTGSDANEGGTSSFFTNKPLEAGVFSILALAVCAIGLFICWRSLTRRRDQEQERQEKEDEARIRVQLDDEWDFVSRGDNGAPRQDMWNTDQDEGSPEMTGYLPRVPVSRLSFNPYIVPGSPPPCDQHSSGHGAESIITRPQSLNTRESSSHLSHYAFNVFPPPPTTLPTPEDGPRRPPSVSLHNRPASEKQRSSSSHGSRRASRARSLIVGMTLPGFDEKRSSAPVSRRSMTLPLAGMSPPPTALPRIALGHRSPDSYFPLVDEEDDSADYIPQPRVLKVVNE